MQCGFCTSKIINDRSARLLKKKILPGELILHFKKMSESYLCLEDLSNYVIQQKQTLGEGLPISCVNIIKQN